MNKTQDTFIDAYNNHSDSMFRYCYIRVSNREEAVDLVQETFLRTWDYIHKGGTIKNLKSFLFTSLNNRITDWYRKKKPVQLEDEVAVQIPDEHYSNDPLSEAERKWALTLLDKLDEETKTVVTLRLVEGWSPKEIAKSLNIKQNAVSVRIHRGLKLLQDFVKNENYV